MSGQSMLARARPSIRAPIRAPIRPPIRPPVRARRPSHELQRLGQILSELRRQLERVARDPRLRRVHPNHRDDARNMLQYLALRRRDRRALQDALARWGLSSLGRCEADVLAQVRAVEGLLRRVNGADDAPLRGPVRFGRAILDHHARELFGEQSGPDVRARIMATLPSEGADDPQVVRSLIDAGASCVRINCAHDDADAWRRMARWSAVRAAGRPAPRVLMDLGGPKLRAEMAAALPGVVKCKPLRDRQGRVIAPVRIWLHPAEHPASVPPGAVGLPILGGLDRLAPGDRLMLRDARGASRSLRIASCEARGALAISVKTAYLIAGTRLARSAAQGRRPLSLRVAALPAQDPEVRLLPGQRIILSASKGGAERRWADGSERMHVVCRERALLARLRVGQRIFFDDGHIGGVVRARRARAVVVEITQCKPGGSVLRAGRGINCPDTWLDVPGLTRKDRIDLDTVVEIADLVGLSFAQRAEDIRSLRRALARRGRQDMPIVLKIETPLGFSRLPQLLLEAMRSPCSGAVMIARGDLAVECGYGRLSELQEEMLWICEAARVPVIWATQVLERLVKKGIPTRAEVTDAAMSGRAECVMLNKGEHAAAAIAALRDILTRSAGHQHKKSPRLRRLTSW